MQRAETCLATLTIHPVCAEHEVPTVLLPAPAVQGLQAACSGSCSGCAACAFGPQQPLAQTQRRHAPEPEAPGPAGPPTPCSALRSKGCNQVKINRLSGLNIYNN